MSEPSHEAMGGLAVRSQTQGQKATSQTKLEHSPSGSPASSAEWVLLPLPFSPPRAIESVLGESLWEASPPKGKDTGSKPAETRVQIPTLTLNRLYDLEEITSLF